MAVNEQLEAWSESSLGEGALKKILSNTIETIEDNKTQIFGIYETAKDEVTQSRKVLEDLKFQARQTIERVDALTVQEQQAKQELVTVSSNFSDYSEERIKERYDAVKEVQVEMGERLAGQSYLTFWRSVQYMVKMSISILLIQWFRKRDTETPYPERSL